MDDFIGYKFGDKKQLEVIGWYGERDKYKNKLYSVKCGICSSDKELFGCPSCSKSGYKRHKKGYFYIIKVLNDFIGYGISNVPKKRIKEHTTNLKKIGKSIYSVDLFSSDGCSILEIERSIKNMFPIFEQNVTGFVRDATYYEFYDDIFNFVSTNLNINHEKDFYVMNYE